MLRRIGLHCFNNKNNINTTNNNLKVFNNIINYNRLFSFNTNNNKIIRNPRYNQVNDSDINYFRSILDSSGISIDKDELNKYNIDWMNKYSGKSKLLLKPTNSTQISNIIKYC